MADRHQITEDELRQRIHAAFSAVQAQEEEKNAIFAAVLHKAAAEPVRRRRPFFQRASLWAAVGAMACLGVTLTAVHHTMPDRTQLAGQLEVAAPVQSTAAQETQEAQGTQGVQETQEIQGAQETQGAQTRTPDWRTTAPAGGAQAQQTTRTAVKETGTTAAGVQPPAQSSAAPAGQPRQTQTIIQNEITIIEPGQMPDEPETPAQTTVFTGLTVTAPPPRSTTQAVTQVTQGATEAQATQVTRTQVTGTAAVTTAPVQTAPPRTEVSPTTEPSYETTEIIPMMKNYRFYYLLDWNGQHYSTEYEILPEETEYDYLGFAITKGENAEDRCTVLLYAIAGVDPAQYLAVQYAGEDHFYLFTVQE